MRALAIVHLLAAAVAASAGRELSIVAEGLSERAIYVQAVELDGAPIDAPELTHAQLAGARTLRFVMGESPSRWGRR